MPEHDLEKLLGGFAADTLTAEEKQQLYQAALHDQTLFTTLVDEQAFKELLADPVVRRRILQSLQATNSATAGGSLSWLDWFRRPAGLAWAGGLTAAVLAVVLGVRIYQDSLRGAGQSVATEEARPAAPLVAAPPTAQPPINEPEIRAKEPVEPPASPRKDLRGGKTAKRESPTSPKPQSSSLATQPEGDALHNQAKPTADKLVHPKEEPPTSAGQEHARLPSPTAPASVPAPGQVPSDAATAGQAASSMSARSLFYGETPRFEATLRAVEEERSEKPPVESSQRAVQSERKMERFAAVKNKRLDTSLLPLGIRYSMQADGTADQNTERTARFTDQVRKITVTIESNQDGYVQVWEQAEALPPHRFFPSDPNGQLSSRLGAHERVTLSFHATFSTLVIRFSRAVANDVEPAMPDRFSHNQLRESVPSKQEDGAQEQATYVVNQDPTLPEIVVRIPITQP